MGRSLNCDENLEKKLVEAVLSKRLVLGLHQQKGLKGLLISY